MKKRVVISGMGCLTPLGNDTDTTWRNLSNGVSGIDYAKNLDLSTFPSKIIGEVKQFDPAAYINNKNLLKYSNRTHQLGIAAGFMAIKDARLNIREVDPTKIGISVGTSGQYPNLEELKYHFRFSKTDRWDFQSFAKEARISPTRVFQRSTQTLSCIMAKLFKVLGPNIVIQTACASGAQAIGQAYRMIERGDASVMIAGGSDAIGGHLYVAAFALLGALSTRKIEPWKASRPFDARRDGFVLSEGAGMIILEELESALKRGANIYAEILGYGTSANAYRVTDYPVDGAGPSLAMERAIKDADISVKDIGYINAHGTSTVQNDISETVAIKNLFGKYAYDIPVSSIKSCLGHLISAAGAVEAIVSALVVKQNLIPPTTNYEYKDPYCDLDYVPNVKREKTVKYVLSNSFGFGGQNACIVIKKFVA